MLNNKSVIFTVVSSLISFALISLSAPLKANDNLHTQSILVAEAHQHGHKSNSQEKGNTNTA